MESIANAFGHLAKRVGREVHRGVARVDDERVCDAALARAGHLIISKLVTSPHTFMQKRPSAVACAP